MAGRSNYLPPDALKLREAPLPARGPQPHPSLIEDPRAHHRRVPVPVEDRIAAQHRDIQTLLVDNQRLAANHVAIKQEIAAANEELRRLSATAAAVKAERDAQVREVYERSLKMEAEVRSIDGLNAELAQVIVDVQKMRAERKELTEKLRAIDGDLSKTRSELPQFSEIQAEVKAMHHEIQRGRAAIEYEKKMQASNLEQSQVMEKNMMSLAREIEKLRADLVNTEKRAMATATAAAAAANPSAGYAAAGYGTSEIGYAGNSEIGYGGNSYHDPYAMRQGQGVNVGVEYGPGAGAVVVPHPHGIPYDVNMQQQNHVNR